MIDWRPLPPTDRPIEWRDRSADPRDHYETLGIGRHAGLDAIKRAYRTLLHRYHPDKQPRERQAWADEMTKRLTAAYAALGTPERRAEYDRRMGYGR